MITENLPTLKIHELTKDQFERELAADNLEKNAIYLTPAEEVVENLKDGNGKSSLEQALDASYTGIAIVTKNPNAAALDSTLTDNEPIGATGDWAVSLGGVSSAQGKRSVAEGTNTVAKGKYSHAEGDNSVTLGNDSHAEGNSTVAFGDQSHSEGINTQAIGQGSHAEGNGTQAIGKYSHTEGSETIAEGLQSHAEGTGTEATGISSHAEGTGSKAQGNASHAGGYSSIAYAENSFAHGEVIRVGENAKNSFAVGKHTVSYVPDQLVAGKWNKNEGSNLFEVGCGGSDESRENAFSAGANIEGKFIFIGDTKLTETELAALKDGSGNSYDDTQIRNMIEELETKTVPTTRTINDKALSSNITLSAADVGARSNTWMPTAADVGAVPTSRTINSKALSSNITLSASDVGAVPTTRTINSKALSSNISLTAADVGARPSTWTPTAADVGAVPTSRTVNGKALSSNITLSATDVSARPNTWIPTASDLGFTGGVSTILSSNLTASRALISNSSGKVAVSAVTSTELGYLDGVTSSIQTQLNDRLQLTIGTAIASNSDLNTFKTPGKYYSGSSTVSGTLTNAPASGAGFGLIVTDGYIDGRVYQIALLSTGGFRIRYFNGTNWTAWTYILTNILTSSTYGSSLPTAGTAGRIFFKKVT